MAKQTFTTGQVLTAAQMTSLQQTAMGGGSATAKTANYVLVAADAGTTVIMNAAGTTTITVNTSLFAAGDSVFIQNIGAGVCTVTAGTATVSTAGSLALAQYEGGLLYFTATGTSIFHDYTQSGGGGGKVLQAVSATYSTQSSTSSTTYQDSGLTASITPSAATSKILVLTSSNVMANRGAAGAMKGKLNIVRGATEILGNVEVFRTGDGSKYQNLTVSYTFLDSPSTTSSTTYKQQYASNEASTEVYFNIGSTTSTITLLEIGA